jgi:sugar phosphate isomerase/epimerase
MIDPKSKDAENIFRACHDAGIRDVKVGYWGFRGGDYKKSVDAARKDIEGFAALGSGLGVRCNLHTHSGSYLGLNAASVMDLARGFNPADVGVYLDPGHLAMHGEPLTIAFSMVTEFLSLIAVKDSEWIKGEGGKPKRSHFLPPGQGLVDWREMMRILAARDYRGPLSFHSEYESLPVDQLLAQTKKDIAFMRGIEADARALKPAP